MNTNWLANIFDRIGETFEKFNPSAYRFLAAVLPYATPLPVAWLTSHSASEFLGFPPNISFIFVFALEGIGLWFTGLLVESVVDWIRSRNWKTFAIVIVFGLVVFAYAYLLVNLNVTLESSLGNSNPTLSKIITMMCFLPLLTGVGNGYYKLKVEHKTKEQESLEYERQMQERIRQETTAEKNERWRLKHGFGKFPTHQETFQADVKTFQKVSNQSRKFPESFYELSSWRRIFPELSREDLESLANMTPAQMQECANETGKTYKTISNWRNSARQYMENGNV